MCNVAIIVLGVVPGWTGAAVGGLAADTIANVLLFAWAYATWGHYLLLQQQGHGFLNKPSAVRLTTSDVTAQTVPNEAVVHGRVLLGELCTVEPVQVQLVNLGRQHQTRSTTTRGTCY